MNATTHARFAHGALVFFAASAILGALFAIVGPVVVMRLLGLVALALATAGCAVELWALRQFDPTGYASLIARLRRRAHAESPERRPGVLQSAVLRPRPIS